MHQSCQSHSILVTVILNCLLAGAQIPDDQIPPELKELHEKGLETWNEPQEIRKGMPYYLSGFDAENRPVWVIEFGKYDLQRLLQKGEKYQIAMEKHIELFLLRIWASYGMRATPEEPVTEAVIILDMDGYNARQIGSVQSIELLVRTMRLLVAAMKFVKSIYVINTNFVAGSLLNLMKPLIGEDFNKMDVFGTNPAEYLPAILKGIPQDQLPEWYGGVKDFKPVEIYA